jgi:hypothetical protein
LLSIIWRGFGGRFTPRNSPPLPNSWTAACWRMISARTRSAFVPRENRYTRFRITRQLATLLLPWVISRAARWSRA